MTIIELEVEIKNTQNHVFLRKNMPSEITVNIKHLTININDLDSDLESLDKLIRNIYGAIASWIELEREQQRTCQYCNVNYRQRECHQNEPERCPYCHNKVIE